MKNVKTITITELKEMLENMKGASFIHLDTVTKQKPTKTNRVFKALQDKIEACQYHIGSLTKKPTRKGCKAHLETIKDLSILTVEKELTELLEKQSNYKDTFANDFGNVEIEKVSSNNYQIGGDYEKRYNAKLEREGAEKNFTAGSSNVTRINSYLYLNEKSGDYQLRVYAIKNSTPKVTWFKNDLGIQEQLYYPTIDYLKECYLPIKKESNYIELFNFNLKNIKRLNINKTEYYIKG